MNIALGNSLPKVSATVSFCIDKQCISHFIFLQL
jgi:hypothetical protein